MSRSRQPVRPPRGRVPVLVVIVLILRSLVFATGIGLTVVLLLNGQDLPSASTSVAALMTACAAAAGVLTSRVRVEARR